MYIYALYCLFLWPCTAFIEVKTCVMTRLAGLMSECVSLHSFVASDQMKMCCMYKSAHPGPEVKWDLPLTLVELGFSFRKMYPSIYQDTSARTWNRRSHRLGGTCRLNKPCPIVSGLSATTPVSSLQSCSPPAQPSGSACPWLVPARERTLPLPCCLPVMFVPDLPWRMSAAPWAVLSADMVGVSRAFCCRSLPVALKGRDPWTEPSRALFAAVPQVVQETSVTALFEPCIPVSFL